MNNIKLLLKYTLINSLGINKLKKKKNGEERSIGLGLMIGLIYLAIFAFVTLYMFMFIEIYKEIGTPDEIFFLIITISSLICFITTISKANVYIFRTKDYDFLMSLPIRPVAIVTTKLLSLYIYNLLFVFTLFASCDVAYLISVGGNIRFVLLSIPALLIVPLFPMAISSFIAFLLGFIPLKQKTKNFASMLLYILLFTALMITYFMSMTSPEEGGLGVYNEIGSKYFLGMWLYDGMLNLNIVSLLLFFGISIGSAIIFVMIVGHFFLAVNGKLSNSKTKSNYKLQEEKYEKKGEVKAIFQKEFSSLINAPSVLIQIASGPIMSLVMSIMMPIVLTGNFDEAGINASSDLMLFILGAFSIFTITLVTSTASSISLEGKSFWIIKSSPVQTKNVFWGKSLVNILFTVPVAIINVVIIEIFFKGNIILAVIVALMVVSFTLFSTFLGLLLNVKFPKFDYDNPVKAVKQGKAMLYNMLIDFLVTIIVAIVAFVAITYINIMAAAIIICAIGLILSYIIYHILFTKGIKIYDNIAA